VASTDSDQGDPAHGVVKILLLSLKLEPEDLTMAEGTTPTPAKTEEKAPEVYRPLENLRREVDRLFDDFGRGFRHFPFGRSAFETEPFWRRGITWAATPAVDVVERDKAYEMTAELPGMDESNIDMKLSNGTLTIKGEKKEEKKEQKKDYYLSERHYGSFQRSFRMPDGVDADKIEASFKKGVLTVILPKTPEAQKKEKNIAIKAE
jgi:HSP20 family protein